MKGRPRGRPPPTPSLTSMSGRYSEASSEQPNSQSVSFGCGGVLPAPGADAEVDAGTAEGPDLGGAGPPQQLFSLESP